MYEAVYNACVDKNGCHFVAFVADSSTKWTRIVSVLQSVKLCRDIVSSSDQRDCCVDQFGLSYSDSGACRPCIGFKIIVNT